MLEGIMPSALDAGRCALPLGTRLGEFELRRVVGAGGFGVVYEAFDHVLQRRVALKEYLPAALAFRSSGSEVVLREDSHAQAYAKGLRAFVQEARLLARFDDAALVKVYRYWQQHGTAYMVMPLLSGLPLREWRSQPGFRPTTASLRALLLPMLGALEKLHSEGVLHRDVSPDNILWLPVTQQPVLLDVGSARQVLSESSAALTAVVKAAYAPIEQYGEADGVRQGPWSDLYALGATLHFMLCGEPPAPSPARVVHDAAPPLARRGFVGVEPALLHVIDELLAPRPQDRPQSVAAVRERLGALAHPVRHESVDDEPGDVERTVVLSPADLPAHSSQRPDQPSPAAVRTSHSEVKPPSGATASPAEAPSLAPEPGVTPALAAPLRSDAPAERGARELDARSRSVVAASRWPLFAAVLLAVVATAWWAMVGGKAGSDPDATRSAAVSAPVSPPTASEVSSVAPALAGTAGLAASAVAQAATTPEASAVPPTPAAALEATARSLVSPSAAAASRPARRQANPAAATAPVAPAMTPAPSTARVAIAEPGDPAPMAAVTMAPTPVAAVVAATPASPGQACGDRNGLARMLCVERLCRTAGWRGHEQCVALRAEREKREEQLP
jgi:serine/threonine protein kinase